MLLETARLGLPRVVLVMRINSHPPPPPTTAAAAATSSSTPTTVPYQNKYSYTFLNSSPQPPTSPAHNATNTINILTPSTIILLL